MATAAKAKRMDDLKTVVEGAKSIVLADFTGLNVKDISELRRICRASGVRFRVAKNTLAKRTFAELGYEGIAVLLDGPTAVAVSSKDEVLPAQILKKFADDYELPRLKGGYVQGRVLSAEQVRRLAVLPGREVLLGQAVGAVQAPLRGLVSVLNASLRDLVTVLKAVQDKKAA